MLGTRSLTTPPHLTETPAAPPPAAPPPADQHLLDAGSADGYRTRAAEAARLVAETLAAVDRPFSGRAARELRPAVEAVDLDRPLPDEEAVLEEVRRLYLDDAVWFHHPSYVAHLNCPVAVPAAVADQVAHPELAGRFAEHDLFAPEFALSCLNRLQLRNNREMVDLADPASALCLHGTLANPLAG